MFYVYSSLMMTLLPVDGLLAFLAFEQGKENENRKICIQRCIEMHDCLSLPPFYICRHTDADGSVEVEQGLLNSDIIGWDQHLE